MTLGQSSSINFSYGRASALAGNPRDIFSAKGYGAKVICWVRSLLPLPNRERVVMCPDVSRGASAYLGFRNFAIFAPGNYSRGWPDRSNKIAAWKSHLHNALPYVMPRQSLPFSAILTLSASWPASVRFKNSNSSIEHRWNRESAWINTGSTITKQWGDDFRCSSRGTSAPRISDGRSAEHAFQLLPSSLGMQTAG